MVTIPAIVVHQPWAWAIVAGHKRIENRTWTPRYRGPLAIVAGRSRASLDHGRQALAKAGFTMPSALPTGALLGVVELVDVLDLADAIQLDPFFAQGPRCWLLASPVALVRPYPCRGKQGLFRLPREVLSAAGLPAPP